MSAVPAGRRTGQRMITKPVHGMAAAGTGKFARVGKPYTAPEPQQQLPFLRGEAIPSIGRREAGELKACVEAQVSCRVPECTASFVYFLRPCALVASAGEQGVASKGTPIATRPSSLQRDAQVWSTNGQPRDCD